MISKMIIWAVCIIAVIAGTVFGIIKAGANSGGSVQTENQTAQIEPSMDIGAIFDKNIVQIKYVSFAPLITRSEAIAKAKDWLNTGFKIPTDDLPANSTVGLFTQLVNPISGLDPDTIGFLTSKPTPVYVAKDVPAWIVVITGLPDMGSAGPPPDNPETTIIVTTQANVVIDATTGEKIYAGIGGKVQRFPAE